MLTFTAIATTSIDTTTPDPTPPPGRVFTRASGERIEPGHRDHARLNHLWETKLATDSGLARERTAHDRAHGAKVAAFWAEHIPGRGWPIR